MVVDFYKLMLYTSVHIGMCILDVPLTRNAAIIEVTSPLSSVFIIPIVSELSLKGLKSLLIIMIR